MQKEVSYLNYKIKMEIIEYAATYACTHPPITC